MPIFVPLTSDGVEITRVAMTWAQLCEFKSVVMMALDYNPSDPEFALRMQEARPAFGNDSAFDTWMTDLVRIATEGEQRASMNFILEDWDIEWRIADFIDRVWPIARIVTGA